jgi:hypothetical protein
VPAAAEGAVVNWSWQWIAVQPAATFGDNPVFDWIRVVAVLEAVLLLMAICRVLVESTRRRQLMPATQMARFAALALAAFSLSMTEVSVVGTPATPRLLTTIVILAVGTYGVAGTRHKQRNDPPVR